jgi:hypothetical protein
VIAKRVPKLKGASNFARLARYVVDARGGADPAGWKRTAEYILDTSHGGEKVGGVRITNCHATDPAMAAIEIGAKQALNKRSKVDRTYHLVVSFPPGERPTLAQLNYIEDELCAAIGFSEHQRISAVHTDTKHLHLHVAISKVHPVSLNCIEPYYDKRRLMEACERLEIELGLQRTNHGQLHTNRITRTSSAAQKNKVQSPKEGTNESRPTGRAADMEAHAARQSFQRWVRERMGTSLEALSGWPDLHRKLAEYDLHARLRGAGLVIGANGEGGLYIQASQVDRDLSLHSLTMRWGKFVTPGADSQQVPILERYDAQPIQRHPRTSELFARYQRERQAALRKRAEARAVLRAAHAAYTQRMSDWYQDERQRLKDDKRIRGKTKFEALKNLSVRRRADWTERRNLEQEQRKAIITANPIKTWPQFLTDLARGGDEQALAILRSRARRSAEGEGGDRVIAAKGADARHILLPAQSARLDKHGDVVYRLQDGGVVIDSAASVRVLHGSKMAMALALVLAQERFAKQRLLIEGTDEFGTKAAQAAADHGIEVSFADERLERLRREAGSHSAWPREQANMGSYIAARNKLREQVNSISEHRRWTSSDVGAFVYKGRRRFDDGSEAVLLQREQLIFVMPVTSNQAAKASTWKVGSSTNVDSRGRFVSATRGPRIS